MTDFTTTRSSSWLRACSAASARCSEVIVALLSVDQILRAIIGPGLGAVKLWAGGASSGRRRLRGLLALAALGGVGGCALSGAGTPAPAAEIVRPEGRGPFPAVVLLHSCAGLVRGGNHMRAWSARLVQMGYIVAIPDSFGPRGVPGGVCGNGMRVPPDARAEDAYATLHQLEDRGDVVAD